MKAFLMSKTATLLWPAIWSITTGVIASVLVIGGQCAIRAMDRLDQQQETRLLIDEVEQSLAINPITMSGETTSNEDQEPIFLKLAGRRRNRILPHDRSHRERSGDLETRGTSYCT